MENMDAIFDPEEYIKEFEAMTRDAGRIQKETLRKILEQNGRTEYMQKWGLDGKTDPCSFAQCVPLVSHSDLEPYVERIVEGDHSPILIGKPIKAISLSSGTTQGKPKFIPFTDEFVENTLQTYKTSYAFRNRLFPVQNGKALQFIYASKQFQTKGGLAGAVATTHLFRTPQFKETMKVLQTSCCSPEEVIFGRDYHQSMYCHLLCGLIHREDVQVVSSTFAFSIVQAFKTFEHVWEEICADIRDGVLTSRVTDSSIRTAIAKLLKPNHELADLIYERCLGLSNWYGLIPALFPNAKYIHGIMTGSMAHSVSKLRHYAADLPLISGDYGSSEGYIGANVNPNLPPESATFALIPNIGYFEFIPLKETSDPSFLLSEPKPVGMTEVNVGEEYELIVTTFQGVYRYRLGDVVKVIGFYNATPEVKFVRRKNHLLNINVDFNTENDLQDSVQAAAKLLAAEKLEVVDFTSHVDLSTDPGHYVIFWEIGGEAKDGVLKECCDCLDKSFLDAGYRMSRGVKGIGPLELRVLRRGTFQEILDHFIGMGGALSQFKTPRCVSSNKKVLHILGKNVVKSYFSAAYD